MRNAEVTAMPTIMTPRRIKRRSWFTLAQWTQRRSKPIEARTVRPTGEGTRGDGGNGVLEYWSVGVVRGRQQGSNLPLLHYSITPSPHYSVIPLLHHST